VTVASSTGAKIFSIACTFAQVPLALHYLGTEAYGFWITLASMVLTLNSVDFGLGVGMQHTMAHAYGRDDLNAIRRTFWSGAGVLALLGVAVLAIGLAVIYLEPWADILKVHDPDLRAEAKTALVIALMSFSIGLPFSATNRLAAALQRGWINAGWIAAGSGLSLCLVAAAAMGRWGFLWFLGASLLVPSIQGLGLLLHLCRTLRWAPFPTGFAPASEIRTMLSSSMFFAFPQVGMALVQSAPALAISMAAGTSAVTGFNLLMRLFSPLQQGQIILMTPIWPAYTEAHARGDHGWIRRMFWRTAAAFLALVIGTALVAWKSQALISLWVGPSAATVSLGFAATVGTWCVLQMAAQPMIYYLVGIGRLRELAKSATPGLVVSSVMLFIGATMGVAKWVIVLGSAAFAFVLLPMLTHATYIAFRHGEKSGDAP
jgi:O-antigen/teichoic acid export membrane protein